MKKVPLKLKHLRWLVVSLVALATVINYIDRSALAIMWPGIAEDLGLDKSDYANIITVFMISYAIGQSLFGKIFDAIGTRLGFLLSIVVWSVSIALHAVAASVTSFAIFRAMLGLGEAGNWPGATKANAEWFPIKERALAQGIFNAGASLGSIIAPPLIAFLYAFLGWQATFIVIGSLGILWILPWLIVYKSSPDSHPWITEEERQHILTGQQCTSEKQQDKEYVPTMGQLLRHRQTWGVIAARFFIDPIWWLFVAWLPLYLNEKFGFDVKQIGAFAWLPYVGAAIGALFGGWFSGHLMSRGWSVNKARRSAIVLGCMVMLPALLLTSLAATPWMAMGLIALILFGFQTAIGNVQTLPSDYFSGKTVGTLAGISGTSAVLSVIITIQLVPMMTKGGDYTPFFILGAALVPLALISLWLGGKIEPVKRKA
ncbi:MULTISPECIES: MFS transporter [Shewanella]|jgi:ACS family hexuronate transporter-like MFS transporter|uniref:Major facilitator superfamily MFS_1 n=2 Tax=Shewanella frigidimarina TaxID=56812 RepID=Q07YH1_SHEFN|nr:MULTISPECIES: MFS transporter [Shewanella]ABI72943.1 major facilitator superfamily MFS_1 [Shewanella frigidimarina NCIMB 400]KVX02825.1 MFS transporter [Shewanella frigidimarina]MBB1427097.1 MFS transporter [Shewanella sp. SG44-2]PKI06762.1 MFS transporter [Shewanella sp. 11B5]RPA38581.1 MFS transporter [Shewanella frigidimarina]|tara:strand:- start:138 stop:1424 length:1287 start_codon:yes stop_codon:yes gene_type:complete